MYKHVHVTFDDLMNDRVNEWRTKTRDDVLDSLNFSLLTKSPVIVVSVSSLCWD